ncbi:MAG: metalloregulator ArsR/SmtB family transcription factor [Spirochaetaceae bacterium]
MHDYLERLKAASEETRFRILRLLRIADEPLCVCELVDILRRPQYAVSRALSALRRTGLVQESRHGKLMFYAFAREPFNDRLAECLAAVPSDDDTFRNDRDRLRWRLEIRNQGECVVTYTSGYDPSAERKPSVLFVCVHNSARSQMAEAYLRRFAGDILDVESAGLEPGELNPYVVEALREDGIDISHKVARSVVDLYRSGRSYSYVITVCDRRAEEKCPIFPGPVRRLSRPFPDPGAFTGTREEILRQTRAVRDQIREQVRSFAEFRRAGDTGSETARRDGKDA